MSSATATLTTPLPSILPADPFNPLTDPKSCPVFLANVTFEPGCRNNWHIHHEEYAKL